MIETKQLKDSVDVNLKVYFNHPYSIDIKEINIEDSKEYKEEVQMDYEQTYIVKNLISTLSGLYEQLRAVQSDSKKLEDWTDNSYKALDVVKSLSDNMEGLVIEAKEEIELEMVSLMKDISNNKPCSQDNIKGNVTFDLKETEGSNKLTETLNFTCKYKDNTYKDLIILIPESNHNPYKEFLEKLTESITKYFMYPLELREFLTTINLENGTHKGEVTVEVYKKGRLGEDVNVLRRVDYVYTMVGSKCIATDVTYVTPIQEIEN